MLAPFTWWWAIDVPLLRATGLTAWAMLALSLGLALGAARRDRRPWVVGVAALALAALVLFVWAFFVASRLPRGAPPARAHDFTLPDQQGRPVTLSQELAHGPVLLVTFRGHW